MLIFLGDCRSILESEDSPFEDATEMAQAIENSISLPDKVKKKIEQILGQTVDELGQCGSIIWGYNSDDDIHYFFREEQ